jgi:nicotinate phosphoribosyltransferase
MKFGIPIVGTMAHSFVQIHDDEAAAFEDFARARPDGVVLLIDTFDTEAGARKVVELAPKLKKDGIGIRGVRIDSGDLIAMSRKVRTILDAGGLKDVIILVSGGVDEDFIANVVATGAPIDGFGVGASLDTSSDAPVLDCAYKLQEYRGKPRRKLSEGKVTWPGRKQVWRALKGSHFANDVISVETDKQPGEPLVVQVMKDGKRMAPIESLAAMRERAARAMSRLPGSLRQLEPAQYPVKISDALEALGREASRR